MFPCQICCHNCATIVTYVRHMRIHKNTPNLTFKCVLPDCRQTFQNFSTFKCHSYRHNKRLVRPTLSGVELTCHVNICSAKYDTLTAFYSHLKTHIREGKTVTCPYRHCSKSFTVLSTFTSHMSRKHKNGAEKNLAESIVNPGVSHESEQDQSDMQIDPPSDAGEENEIYPEIADESQFFKNLALFYLKLQAKCLLPSSVIQTIIEDFQEIHDISQSHLLFKLKDKLITLGISEPDTNNVIEVMKTEDLFRTCNTQPLKTDQKRKTVFKNSFNYVEPVQICLGQNEAGKECFAQYVPIKQTIDSLFHCQSVQEQYKQVHSRIGSKDILKDVWDGKNMTENVIFQTESSSLSLILYQDAFEVVNPLGSGKKKHKILAVYLTLADLMPHNRSSTDQMQLVLLCKEHDFKYFGQDLVMGTLVNDLKDLELNGVTLSDGKVYKGTLCAIAGDNLGSHNIGGFVENFSRSSHFCRYCEISREAFHADPLIQGTKRTVQSYSGHVQSSEGQTTSSGGVKFDSVFNTLKYFHVCQPGLPPCLGHDLFEGIVSSDLALYINHLVKVDKMFNYLELNQRINQFKYLGRDANDKPCEVNPEAEKLGGHAVQNWCLLRMLPVLIGDKVKNPGDNKVWQLVLQLREVVDLICAPAISNGQIAYLRVLIDEYLHCRIQTFPDNPLKPKHHYVSHYPELIIQFGPLIRLWTLRFESKHTYFKQCMRKLRNFKNPCSTLAERHQLLQAFLSAGTFFPPCVSVERGTQFFSDDYNDVIIEAVAHHNFESTNTLIANEVTVKGTKYKKNMLIVIDDDDEGFVTGKIKVVLIHKDSAVYFIAEKYHALRIPDMGVYSLTLMQRSYCCINQENLLDYYPLPEYTVHGTPLIILHHSFPLVQNDGEHN